MSAKCDEERKYDRYIALANASDVLYKYLRTSDQIRVNGRWTFPFRRIVARDNRWANYFRSTIAARNFPEASNGHVNRRKRTNKLVQDSTEAKIGMVV